MGRQAENGTAKKRVQLFINENTLDAVQSLFCATAIRSFSQFAEAALFHMKTTYLISPKQLLRDLQQSRAEAFLGFEDLTAFPKQKGLHITLDVEAFELLDHFCGKYPVLFGNRSEVLGVYLEYLAAFCRKGNCERYMAGRLREALEMRPSTGQR